MTLQHLTERAGGVEQAHSEGECSRTASHSPAEGCRARLPDKELLSKSFQRHLRASNAAPRTIQSYLEAVTQFRAFLALFHGQNLDLKDHTHVIELCAPTDGADLVVIDTPTACWSGHKNDNAAVVKLETRS